jgi:hypothetical protein
MYAIDVANKPGNDDLGFSRIATYGLDRREL